MYGKPKAYPYYFKVLKKGETPTTSGVFKTKKLAIERAKEFSKHKGQSYKVFDRRKKKK